MNNLSIITIQQEGIQDFSKIRNRELEKAKTDWVLFLDSDEKLSKDLEVEVEKAIKSDEFDAYMIPRLDTFMGKRLSHGEPGSTKLLRLAKKSYGKWERPVHEVWRGAGRVRELKNPILHTPHESIGTFLKKINTYSEIEAKYRRSKGQKSSLLHIIFFPPLKFVYNYIFKLGFLDGVPGTIMAIMMSFHSYLTWTKLYLLQQQ